MLSTISDDRAADFPHGVPQESQGWFPTSVAANLDGSLALGSARRGPFCRTPWADHTEQAGCAV
jgi:hypothetical protein